MLICQQSYGEGNKDVTVEEYRAPTPRRMAMGNGGGNSVSPRDTPVKRPFVAAPSAAVP